MFVPRWVRLCCVAVPICIITSHGASAQGAVTSFESEIQPAPAPISLSTGNRPLAHASGKALSGIATDHQNYQAWQHTGSLFILTTPDGANLPASASEIDFPLLVRLNTDTFDFRQAQPHGEDIRFSASDDVPLSYQIEEWNPASGAACIWVRLPRVEGNARQEIKIHWGNGTVSSESSGPAVFSESNGYLSVFHMDDPVRDEIATVQSTNQGTTATAGIIGNGRHFAGGQGIFCGEQIPDYPSGGSAHSTEAWFRIEKPQCDHYRMGQRRRRPRQQSENAVSQPAAPAHRQRLF